MTKEEIVTELSKVAVSLTEVHERLFSVGAALEAVPDAVYAALRARGVVDYTADTVASAVAAERTSDEIVATILHDEGV